MLSQPASFSSSVTSASGAVTFGLWLASSSSYSQPASRRARSANAPKTSPGAIRVQ